MEVACLATVCLARPRLAARHRESCGMDRSASVSPRDGAPITSLVAARKVVCPMGHLRRVAMESQPAASEMPVDHIHGEADRLFPVALTHPDVIVPRGEHALSLFSPSAVNEFLTSVLGRFADQSRSHSGAGVAGECEIG